MQLPDICLGISSICCDHREPKTEEGKKKANKKVRHRREEPDINLDLDFSSAPLWWKRPNKFLSSFGYTTPCRHPTSMCAELCKQADSKHTRHHQFPEQPQIPGSAVWKVPWKARERAARVAEQSTSRVLLEIIIAEHLSYALCRLIVVVFAVRSCRCPADNQTRLVAPILSGCTRKNHSNFKKIFLESRTIKVQWLFKLRTPQNSLLRKIKNIISNNFSKCNYCQFWRLLAESTPHASRLEYFKRNLANAVSIDLADLARIWISFAFGARGPLSLWLLFSCFGCCVCVCVLRPFNKLTRR